VRVGKVLIPMLLKGVAYGAAGMLGGHIAVKTVSDAAEKVAEEAGDEAANALTERLEDLEKRHAEVASFRSELAEFAKQQSNPVIVLVDELDRCRPSFAVHVLERIKHFFDVSNVVFVLLMSRLQLEAAIKGIYGTGVDSSAYLQKFLTLTLSLPKRVTTGWDDDDHSRRLLAQLAARLGYQNSDALRGFTNSLAIFAAALGMSIRDLERSMVYYGLAGQVGVSAPLVAYLIALRVCKPELFAELRRGGEAAHRKGAAFARTLIQQAGSESTIPELIFDAHEAVYSDLTKWEPSRASSYKHIAGMGGSPESVWNRWLKRLDLSVR
jgi:hypothetical protein